MGIINDEFNKEVVVFGGGCFWCTEAVFKTLKGIFSVEPGYAGGDKENPIYEDVAFGETGHAEVVQVEYDPAKISFDNLLTVFFATHNPTTLNRQGRDVGTQYRSVIFYTTEEQHKKAKEFIKNLNQSNKLGKPIVTQVEQLKIFFEAEQHHKDYYKKHPEQNYCQFVINPKLEKVQKEFAQLLKKI